MGKIDVPLMGWHVGAFGQVAKIAEVTVIDDTPVILALDAIHFHGR